MEGLKPNCFVASALPFSVRTKCVNFLPNYWKSMALSIYSRHLYSTIPHLLMLTMVITFLFFFSKPQKPWLCPEPFFPELSIDFNDLSNHSHCSCNLAEIDFKKFVVVVVWIFNYLRFCFTIIIIIYHYLLSL